MFHVEHQRSMSERSLITLISHDTFTEIPLFGMKTKHHLLDVDSASKTATRCRPQPPAAQPILDTPPNRPHLTGTQLTDHPHSTHIANQSPGTDTRFRNYLPLPSHPQKANIPRIQPKSQIHTKTSFPHLPRLYPFAIQRSDLRPRVAATLHPPQRHEHP